MYIVIILIFSFLSFWCIYWIFGVGCDPRMFRHRSVLHFEPQDMVATVVTCGGLCPGLNAVGGPGRCGLGP